MDAEGVRQRYQGRNRVQNDLILSDSSVTSSLEELHENGEDAVSLDPESLEAGEFCIIIILLAPYVFCNA